MDAKSLIVIFNLTGPNSSMHDVKNLEKEMIRGFREDKIQ